MKHKKFKAMTMMSGFILFAGLILKPGSVSAVCTALTALGIAFMGGHALQDFRTAGAKKEEEAD